MMSGGADRIHTGAPPVPPNRLSLESVDCPIAISSNPTGAPDTSRIPLLTCCPIIKRDKERPHVTPNAGNNYANERFSPDPVVIDRDDIRFEYLAGRGINSRFIGGAKEILLARDRQDIETVLSAFAKAGSRVKVRGGGHCFEALVDAPGNDLLIDTSSLTGVSYDDLHRAFKVGSGTTLGQLYRDLFLGWGVTVPAGRCPTVAVGGHIMGGGGGGLSRRSGLSVDHLYGVEVVVVDGDGKPRTVTATADPDDPNLDLWWTHTGGGGGVGVVTNYYFATPYGDSLLVHPPREYERFSIRWSWEDIDEEGFTRIVSNYLSWLSVHGSPDSPDLDLDTSLTLPRRTDAAITLNVSMSIPNETPEIAEIFVRDITSGSSGGVRSETSTVPFIDAMLEPDEYDGIKGRFKAKSAFLVDALRSDQVSTIYRFLTDENYANPAAMLHISSYGGQINAVSSELTAMPHRDACAKLYWSCFWWDSREDSTHLSWISDFYTSVFGDAGGRPGPGEGYGGALINYPDLDLLEDSTTIGGDWRSLYFRENAARLAEIKHDYDPLDLFGHQFTPGR